MSLLRINRQPTGRQLLVFSVAWLLCAGFLAGSLWWKGRHPAALIAGAFAVAVPLAGLFSQGFLRAVFVGLSYAVYPLGFVVSHVVLAVLYFVVLSPVGLLMRLFGYNPLRAGFDRKASSYWQPRDEEKPSESYLRQT